MKILLFLFAFFPTFLFSQIFVEDYDINADEEIQYCQVSGIIGFKKTIRVIVDYGQEIRRWNQSMEIKDKDGEVLNFKSIVDLMNFMGKNGWELVDSFYHPDKLREKYTFRKKK